MIAPQTANDLDRWQQPWEGYAARELQAPALRNKHTLFKALHMQLSLVCVLQSMTDTRSNVSLPCAKLPDLFCRQRWQRPSVQEKHLHCRFQSATQRYHGMWRLPRGVVATVLGTALRTCLRSYRDQQVYQPCFQSTALLGTRRWMLGETWQYHHT